MALIIVTTSIGAAAEAVIPNQQATGNPVNTQPLEQSTKLESAIYDKSFEGLNVLVYDGGGPQSSIRQALPLIGISVFDLRTPGNPVTLTDLATHDILIVGWNWQGNMSGLNPATLFSGINGGVLLTGHDADYHAYNGPVVPARTFLSQAISFVAGIPGTGLVALGDNTTIFSYLPEEWGISCADNSGDTITTFTAEGLASGVYNGLTPSLMSGWTTSYHATFASWGAQFVPFDLNGARVVTIATISPFSSITLTKTDDINDGDCVVPGQEINYTITYDYIGAGEGSVWLIDYLPEEVDYNSSSPEGDYNAVDGTVSWNIGTIPSESSGTFTIKGFVNTSVDSCSVFTNSCRITGDSIDETAEVNTPVCFWNQIIYVDHNATGLNNGLSWEHAYLDLQAALDRASIEVYSEIWVAAGTYKPSVPSGSPTFQFIDSVPVYGHFAGTETAIWQRDFNDPNYETFLSGVAVPAPFIVTASGHSSDNILDGFRISGAGTSGDGVKIENAFLKVSNCIISGASVAGYGIYDINSAFKVTDCIIHNSSIGIYANFQNNGALPETRIENSIIRDNQTGIGLYRVVPALSVEVENCLIHNNNYGVLCTLSSSTPVVKGCLLFSNSSGIYLNSSSAAIFNNWIYRNSQAGIYLYYPVSPTTIRNNTLACNNAYGIYRYGGTAPVINSSIICSNASSDLGGNTAIYSWLTADGDPCFVDTDINDFHLRPFSLCVNAGDPNFNDFNDVDIDGQCRIMIGKTAPKVDIGADEIDWPKADFDRDEVINFNDYRILASGWQTINTNCTLDTDDDVDIDDLVEFGYYWLWKTPSEE
ncbi:MAG: right-handed parallel beta-helix repeat-containing protein [Planctomycetota bacterium]